jgi:hypothetical protein
VYVAWRKLYEGNIRDIAISRSDDGGESFSEPRRIHADEWMIDGCPHHGPSLGVDSQGNIHAAWYSGKEGASGSSYAISSDGGKEFQMIRKIEFSEGRETTHPVIVPNVGGVILAVEEWGSGGNSVHAVLYGSKTTEVIAVPGKFPSLDVRERAGAMAFLRDDSVFVKSFVGPEE